MTRILNLSLGIVAVGLIFTALSGAAFGTSSCSCGGAYKRCGTGQNGNVKCTGGETACCGCGTETSICFCCDDGKSCTSSGGGQVGTAVCQ